MHKSPELAGSDHCGGARRRARQVLGYGSVQSSVQGPIRATAAIVVSVANRAVVELQPADTAGFHAKTGRAIADVRPLERAVPARRRLCLLRQGGGGDDHQDDQAGRDRCALPRTGSLLVMASML